MTLAEIRELSADYGRPEFVGERVPTLAELAAMLPESVALALELKAERFVEPQVCLSLIQELEKVGVKGRTVVLSFSFSRLQCVRAAAPDIPVGWITLRRLWPRRDSELLGPFWPLLLLNPAYVALAHRRNQLVCPLDPAPDKRLWLYRWLGCDAVLSDDPGATRQALVQQAGRNSGPPGSRL
jgi:glycerophosphoryl diester phosphodiesterase